MTPVATTAPKTLPLAEFVALVAFLTSLGAMSIDAMLPALPRIGQDLGVGAGNEIQWVVSSMFVGFGLGQLFFGPLSDSIGRKNSIYAGTLLFAVGSLLALSATSFPALLAGRVMQGVGAAASRTVSIAIIRDQCAGREMARIMSFVMSVFILVPAIAPSVGQAVLAFATWRAIFGLLLLQSVLALVWFALRQPETLAKSARKPLSIRTLIDGARAVFTQRQAMGYTLVAGLVSGAFVAYLSTAQQIFVGLYDAGEHFPLYFGALALAIGLASIVNSALVLRLGMRRLTTLALTTMVLTSLAFLAVVFTCRGIPPLWALMTYMLPLFFCVGILFGNVNAMAMAPLGAVAGLGAAVVGALATLISIALGAGVGQAYNHTMYPLVGGFCFMGLSALAVTRWVEGGASDDQVA